VKLRVKPVFVRTRNVRNFEVMMDGLAQSAGEGRLGLVYSRAGRGKTRTAQWYAANNRCVYLRVASVWRTGETDFLRALCRELGIVDPPKRKGAAFGEALDAMISDPRPVYIDELEKLPGHFLDTVRDLSDLSTAPVILLGEEELHAVVRRNRRVWSRVYQQVAFDPIGVPDVMVYAGEAAGVKLSPQTATILHKAAEGDFRIIRRDVISLVQICNANGTADPDEKMARIAVKAGLQGGGE